MCSSEQQFWWQFVSLFTKSAVFSHFKIGGFVSFSKSAILSHLKSAILSCPHYVVADDANNEICQYNRVKKWKVTPIAGFVFTRRVTRHFFLHFQTIFARENKSKDCESISLHLYSKNGSTFPLYISLYINLIYNNQIRKHANRLPFIKSHQSRIVIVKSL